LEDDAPGKVACAAFNRDRQATVADSSLTRTFAHDPATVGQARMWAREHVSARTASRPRRNDLADDIATVVSELMTNALRAGSAHTVVTLHIGPEAITVAVTDSVAALPELREAGPTETSGRGLQIVAALSTDWGVTTWNVGKTVWAEVPVDGSLAAQS
jgi:anti-sigma regulatory factor (Ser/Thr protein kinase)